LDTGFGKKPLQTETFFQKMYSKSHFKKFFRSKWLIELLQMPSVAPDTDFGQKVPKQALLF
jgi:hypothetical protein